MNLSLSVAHEDLGIFQKLACDKIGLMPLLGMGLQIIGKEEHFEDGKHDEQLDGYDEPKRSAQTHAKKPLIVEVENL